MARVEKKEETVTIKGKTVAELAKEMKGWQAKKKKAEEAAEFAGKHVHEIAVKRLPPLLEDIEGDGINLPGVGYVRIGIELYPFYKKDDEPIFYKWLRDNEQGSIIKETIHPKTLQAWAGDMIDDPETAGTLPPCLTVAKVPTAKVLKEQKSKKRR